MEATLLETNVVPEAVGLPNPYHKDMPFGGFKQFFFPTRSLGR